MTSMRSLMRLVDSDAETLPSRNFLLELEQMLTDATGNPMYSYPSLTKTFSSNDTMDQKPPEGGTDQAITGSWGVPIDQGDLDQSTERKAQNLSQDI